ncbi:MAG: outer membrane beta-barrel protein [Cytophagaceae bacterium]|jgi:hypothetical protein|nr:outer membrane beta-barrel protein [Cytophagaceae bacterium]
MHKLLLILFSLPVFLGAQESKKPTRYLELGLGANSYKGDLSHQYSKWKGSLNATVVNSFGKRLSGTFNFQWGGITAQNATYQFDDLSNPQPSPNKFANTTFLSLHYGLRLNFLRKNGFSAYVSQGIGLFRFLPKDDNDQKLQSQLNTRKEGEEYSNLAFYFPTSLGITYVLPQGYGISLQGGWMNTNTDYLDNISLWGTKDKNDNILCYKLSFVTPLSFKDKVKSKTSGTTKPSNTAP